MSKFIYDHVILIGVDGAGCFFGQTDTPNIDRIFRDGAYNNAVITSNPTISAQCWGSMLHGVTARTHRLTNGLVGSVRMSDDFPYDSIFKVLRRTYPDCVLASISNWNPINDGIIEDGLGVITDTGDDDEVCEKVCNVIREKTPKFLFVQMDSVDGAGHHYGYGTQGHLSQITYCDGLVGKMYEAAKEKGMLENGLFIVTADHGGTPEGGHGGDTLAERLVSFFATGKTVIPGEFGEMEIRDTPAIVAYALGAKQPDCWSARIPDKFFVDCESLPRPSEVPADGSKRYSDRPNEDTPTQAGRRLCDFINTDGLTCYFPFDGDCKDALGKIGSVGEGKLYYTDGFYGKALAFDDGVVNCEPIRTGKVDYTMCMWLKVEKAVPGEKWTFFTTMKDDSDKGIRYSICGSDMLLEVSLGDGRIIRHSEPLPANFEGNYFHFLNKYNRRSNETCFYFDFGIDCDWYSDIKIPPELELDGSVAKIGGNVPITIDDFIVFNHNANDMEIDTLCKYYEENPIG